MNISLLKKLLASVIFLAISLPLFSAIPFINNNNTLIVLDSDSKKPLPDRFRNITTLNISGSAQFTPEQVAPLKSAINKENIYIVDLRQESHGFVNDLAISFYDRDKDLNNGLTSTEVISTENSLLKAIKINSSLNIYDKLGKKLDTVTVSSVSNEDNLVTSNGLKYLRLAVKDAGIPSPLVIDEFVQFIKTKDPATHLHFHCDTGEGRTTTFMVLYQIMNNTTNLSLEQILTYQVNMGGIVLTDDSNRAYFLDAFYNYVEANKENNYETAFSSWIQE